MDLGLEVEEEEEVGVAEEVQIGSLLWTGLAEMSLEVILMIFEVLKMIFEALKMIFGALLMI